MEFEAISYRVPTHLQSPKLQVYRCRLSRLWEGGYLILGPPPIRSSVCVKRSATQSARAPSGLKTLVREERKRLSECERKGASRGCSDETLCGTSTKSSVSQEEFLLLELAESRDRCRKPAAPGGGDEALS